MRITFGIMFVWVFFENLRKSLYTATGYANLIHNYIENGHAPAAWKSVMALAAAHASMAAPLQAVTEISLGVLLVVGLFTRPAALVLCIPHEPMDFGVGYGVDMGAAGSSNGCARAGRGSSWPHLGRRCILVAQATVHSVVVEKWRSSEGFRHSDSPDYPYAAQRPSHLFSTTRRM
jgi:hypothetical protein